MIPQTSDILANPIDWRAYLDDKDVSALLSNLQANILKGHGRDHTGNIFVSFGTMGPPQIAELLRTLSTSVTSALSQLRAAATYRALKVNGGRVICVFLSASGYAKLGLADPRVPSDPAFRAGMRARGAAATLQFENMPPLPGLNDPSPAEWGEGPWASDNPVPDAMILIADDSTDAVTAALEAIEKVIGDVGGAHVLGVDRGEAQRRIQPGGSPKGEGLEHFGYVDGRSQPLFLTDDIGTEPKQFWDPQFPPAQFIVSDPGSTVRHACGSYFVYRKLEQNVKAFKDGEAALGAKLGLTTVNDQDERAGAMIVGRFENGTPRVLECDAVDAAPPNDFNYDKDATGLQCPLRAHIRKTNPRGESDRKHGPVGPRGERTRIMARRGITYGQRAPRGPDGDFAKTDRPEGQVGLLFMAYMSNVAEQFEFTQVAWAGNTTFVERGTGADIVIGQRGNTPGTSETHWLETCSGRSGDHDVKVHVKLKGGDYFFAPSISFLTRPLG